MNGFLDDIKGAFRRSDNAHIQMILINVIVFVCITLFRIIIYFFKSDYLFNEALQYVALPAAFNEFIFKPWTLITYSFVHGSLIFQQGLWHIVFNLLGLYWFGAIISEFLGSRRLINTYILGAVAGGIVYLLAYNLIPDLAASAHMVILIGASASVYAIVVAAATLLPDYTFYMILIGPVKIKYVAMFYIFLSLIGTIGNNAGGNFAHLGGALLGFIFIRQLKVGNDLGKPLSALFDFFKRINQPKQKIKVSYRNDQFYRDNYKSSQDLPDQEEIDRILDKISVSGYASLSKEEKEKLFSASQKK